MLLFLSFLWLKTSDAVETTTFFAILAVDFTTLLAVFKNLNGIVPLVTAPTAPCTATSTQFMSRNFVPAAN